MNRRLSFMTDVSGGFHHLWISGKVFETTKVSANSRLG